MDDLEQRLRALFLEDLQDGLRALRDGVADLRRPDTPTLPGVQRELFRVAHSLKGAAHSAGVLPAVDICHRLEEEFARAQSGHRPVDETLFEEVERAVAALALVEAELSTGSPAATPAPPVPVAASPPVQAPPPPAPQEPRLRVAVRTADQLVAQVTDLVDELSRAGVTDRGVVQVASRLIETSRALRLQPFAEVCVGLDRAAADVAAAEGKQVRLLVEGGETRLDRSVGAALREPLLHLVRNAVDHGVEPPARRRADGKAEQGEVVVRSAFVEGRIEITVTDDGAGLDLPALRAASAGRDGDADEGDDADLAFLPGVSTAPAVTVVSGRGVGLDAVRDRVERLGGAVRLSSSGGRGTTVVLTVPATLATVRVLLVRSGRALVGLPVAALDQVQETVRLVLGDVGGRQVLLGGDEPLPVVPLDAALSLGEEPGVPGEHTAVVRLASGDGALQVDGVEGEIEGVLRPLPLRVAGLPGVLGLLGLPGGGLAPVLNPASCLRWGLARSRPRPSAGATPRRPRRVLLAEDTLTTRVLEQSILETAGYEVVAASDGAEAWQLLQSQPVDIVVTDVDMPRMTGIELCRAIRRADRVAGLPVVLVTSLGSEEDRRRGAEAGADAYLVKSAFDRQVLLETVGRLV